jgi:hypothetical protein
MLRDVIVHLQNEQPLLADLPALPNAGDSCLVCTNLRGTDGKPPVFVGSSDSTFVFPLSHVRFIEIRAAAMDGAQVPLLAAATGGDSGPEPAKAPEVSLDRLSWMDEFAEDAESVDVLRRIRGE